MSNYSSIDPYDQRGKIFKMVAMFPAVDAEPVRHGRWEDCYPNDGIMRDTVYACSVCGAAVFKNFAPKMNFCPNCGAKMDGDVDG
jgi:rubrerythrin